MKQKLITGSQRFTWTSGRKCNFDGCNREDLQPAIVKGWFWPPTGIKIPYNEAETRPLGPWSTTGGDGRPQPDNRELRLTVYLRIPSFSYIYIFQSFQLVREFPVDYFSGS